MSGKHPKYRWSWLELKAYLGGRRTGRQAHGLERAAMDDPFLAEALEGLETVEPDQVAVDLQALRARLDKQKRIAPAYWRWAAGISVLLLASAAIWFVLHTSDALTGQPVAIESKKDAPQKKDTMSTQPAPLKLKETAANDIKPDRPKSVIAQKERPNLVSKPAETAVVILPNPEPTEEALTEAEPIADRTFESESLAISDFLEEDTPVVIVQATKPAAKMSTTGAATRSLREESNALVMGKVTDELGEPLPGVAVLEKGTTNGTLTDLKGHFQMELTKPQATLVVAFVGMQSVEVEADGSEQLNVTMMPDVMSLSEVVVVGYGADEDQPAELGYESPVPLENVEAYTKYLKAELRYPEEASKQGIKGRVVLKLTISASGEIEAVEVKKALGYGCDEEAIRLVKEGPAWKPAQRDGKPVPGSVRVRVDFE